MITSCYKEKFWSHLIKFWAFPVWALCCHLGYSSDILRHCSHCGKWFVALDFHFDTRDMVSGLWLLVSGSNAELFWRHFPFFSQFLPIFNSLELFAIDFREWKKTPPAKKEKKNVLVKYTFICSRFSMHANNVPKYLKLSNFHQNIHIKGNLRLDSQISHQKTL